MNVAMRDFLKSTTTATTRGLEKVPHQFMPRG